MVNRFLQNMDVENTRLLNLDELYVENVERKSNGRIFNAWLKDPEMDVCPFCGSLYFRNQGMFIKEFRDLIPAENGCEGVLLHFHFYKYCCTNPECRKLFAKPIAFADRNDRLTYRAEEQVARMVMAGMAFSEIKPSFPKPLSRQGVSDVFQRWVARREEARPTPHPSSLAIFTGSTGKSDYTLFLGLDDGIRVLDILLDSGPMEITAKLRAYGLENIHMVLTDCNTVVSETVMDLLPNAACILPVQCWLSQVTKEFRTFVQAHARRSSLSDKAHYLWEPVTNNPQQQDTIQSFIATREKVRQPYLDYRQLCDIISSRSDPWTYSDLAIWESSICEDLRNALGISFLLLDQNRDAIYQHELHRDAVPSQLQKKASDLEECIQKQKIFCEEVLRAKVLYSANETDNGQGVPIDSVIDAMKNLNGIKEQTTGGNFDDYK